MPAVDQALLLLEALATSPRGRLSLTELCRQAGIHNSKGYSVLNTLGMRGYVVRNEATKAYSLGPGVLALSRSLLDRTDLAEEAAPHLEALAAGTGCMALIGLVSVGRVFVVARREAPTEFGLSIRLGHHYPLTWGAHGKAIVAFLPAAERDELLASGPLRFSGGDGTDGADGDGLRAELAEVVRLGYARDMGGIQPGINAVSAPLLDHRRRPAGCVIVVGTFPATAVPSVGEQVATVARALSARVGTLLNGAPSGGRRTRPGP